jgi:polysaccharide biosynthesis protein PslG
MSATRVCISSILLSLVACSTGDNQTLLPVVQGRGEPLVDRVGVSVPPLTLSNETAATKQARIGMMDRVASVGLRHIRGDLQWSRIEKVRGQFDFSGVDAVLADADARGLHLLAMLGFGNALYPSRSGAAPSTTLPLDPSPVELFPPTDSNDYARFVAAVVDRYQRRISAYEFWNEPNIGYRFWRPGENASDFAGLVVAAGQAGKRACPSCTFLPGGLSMPQPIPGIKLYTRGDEFTDQMFEASPNLHNAIDAYNIHPYQYPKDPPEFDTSAFAEDYPENFQGSLQTQMRRVARRLRAHDAQMPIWITENGWPTNPLVPQSDAEIARVFGTEENLVRAGRGFLGDDVFAIVLETVRGVPEQSQANYMVRAVLLGLVAEAPRQYLYGIDDFPLEPELNQEAAFGVFRVDGSPKLSAASVRTLMTTFAKYRFAGDVTSSFLLTADDHVVALTDDLGHTAYAFWRSNEKSQQPDGDLVLSRVPHGTQLMTQDGSVLSTTSGEQELSVPLTPSVHYVITR